MPRPEAIRPAWDLAWSVAGKVREPLTVTEWANRFRWFAHGQSWKSQHFDAPYDVDDAPFQRKPQDDLLDPDVQVHAWMMASRIAKTVMMGNGFGYFSHWDPTTQLFMYPSQDDADLRSREEFQPLIDVSPELAGKYHDVNMAIRGQGADNTISFKKYRGGSVAFVGSNAPSKLRARTARVIWDDECDGYRPSAGKEGDPVMLSFNRAKNYPDPVKVVASTPTIKHHSVIEFWMGMSDFHKWFVECAFCGAKQFLTWKHYRWPGDDRAATQLHCEMCDKPHNDKLRNEIICGGEWRHTMKFSGVRGFYLPGYYTVFPAPKAFEGKMHEMAEEAHRAKHSQEPKETIRVWVNTFLTESYLEESDTPPDWQNELMVRREKYDRNSLPAGVVVLTAGTDFQADRIEIVIWGHGEKDESWRIEKHVINGDPRMPNMYQQVEGILMEPFKREDGATLHLKAAGFDTGYYACMRQLYKWLAPRQRFSWYAFKGASQVDADPVTRAKKSRVRLVTLLMVGTHKIKSFIYNRANISTPGPGYMHFPDTMTEADFTQLFAEESKSIFKSGVEYKEFCLPLTGNKRNEELDCAVMAHAALYARGHINLEFEEKRNLKTISASKNGQDKEKPSGAPAIKRRRVVRSRLIKSLLSGGM